MKKLEFLFIALAAIAMSSCTKEIMVEEPHSFVKKTFTASMVETKAHIDGANHVLWSVGDQIAVYDGVCSVAHPFTVASGAETQTGTLEGTVCESATTFTAVTPAAAAKGFAAGKLSVAVPSVQTAGENNIDESALLMVAQTTSDELNFINVNGVLKVTVDIDDINKIVIRANDAKALAGTAVVNPATGEVESVSDAVSELVLNPAGATFAHGDYYITALPASVEGITLKAFTTDNKVYARNGASTLNLQRSHILPLGGFSGHVAQSFFVTPTGAGDKSGANWDNAMDIATFNAALKNNAGSSYYFAEGSYAGLSSAFAVGAELYGGYPAGLTGTQLTGRDPETHETIFSNTGGERILGHFTATTAVVDGITFSATTVNKVGAGLSVSANGANMTVRNCKFTGLQATQGAALYSANSAVVSMERCTFTGNTATKTGGAISVDTGVKCTVKACTFTNNTANGFGTAIQVLTSTSSLTVSSSTFTSNNTSKDGGAIQLQNGTATVDDCTFDSNASMFGGAFNINNDACVVKINGCRFIGNKPTTEMRGASVVNLGAGTCMMNNCFVSGNGVANEHDGNCVFRAFNGSRLMIANTFIQDNITRSTHAIQQGANTLFANVTMVGEAPAMGLWAPNTLNVWVNTALLNSKGGISVHGNSNTSAFKVALKGGCVLQGYDNFGAATVTKTATDVDNATYADLNVTKNAEGKYVIGNYPAGWAKSSDTEVAEVLRTNFTVGATNYGQQFYNWLHEINAL